LTTVHAESAAGVFTRLMEIGVEPYALASAALASISQRLVRALCPKCRRRGPPTPAQVERLATAGTSLPLAYHPVGCTACGTRGYLGRTALYELLEVTPDVATRINARVTTAQIAGSAGAGTLTTLLQDGLFKAEAGVTSLDEVLRVLA
jgi:general secretion pathway protein E